MALIPVYFEGNIWSSNLTQGVKYKVGIYNRGGIKARIRKVYIKNIISNPQEFGHLTSFAISLGGYDYSGLSDPNIILESYFISYPSYYGFNPGNIEYDSSPITSNITNYRTDRSFDLDGFEYFWFDLKFTPSTFQIDYYRADLVVEFMFVNDNKVKTIEKRIEATLTANIDEVDTKDFVMEINGVNGVPLSSILILQ
jgi:hypothetical protein